MKNKGQGSFWYIIAAVIAIFVLLVVMFIFRGQTGTVEDAYGDVIKSSTDKLGDDCADIFAINKKCVESAEACTDREKPGEVIPNGGCEDNKVCCKI